MKSTTRSLNCLLSQDSSQDDLIGLLHDLDLMPPHDCLNDLFELFMNELSSQYPRSLLDELRLLGKVAIDTCGTGGSGKPRFNVSTTVAIIVAACGVPVVKFGNRAVTGRSGSVDFLDALGLPTTDRLESISKTLHERCIVFLNAPAVYPLTGTLQSARRAIGKPTLLNFIAPLLNPIFPVRRLTGVSCPEKTGLMAKLVASLNYARKIVLANSDGIDELSCHHLSTLYEVNGCDITRYQIDPCSILNQERACSQTDRDGSPSNNAAIFLSLIRNRDRNSCQYASSLMNAGAALYAAGKADSIALGVDLVKGEIESGKVEEFYRKLKEAK